MALGLLASSARAVDPAQDTSDLADSQVGDLVAKIKAKFATATPTVAVFPAANKSGQVPSSLAEPALTLQGELIFKLRIKAQGQMFVLSKAALLNAFKSNSVAPQGIDIANVALTADTLKDIKVNAAIQPQFGVASGSEAVAAGEVKVSFKIVFKDGASDQPQPVTVDPVVVQQPSRLTKRFNVEILVGGQPLPLQIGKDPDSGQFDVLFLELDSSLKGKEYQIRITNRGKPPEFPGFNHASDPQRLYAVAVMVDGVSSFLEQVGGSQPELAVLHPKNATKWVFSPPASVVVPGDPVVVDVQKDEEAPAGTTADGVKFVQFSRAKLAPPPAGGKDGSVVTIPGFQENLQTARAFTFAEANESAAALVGVTNDVGMIAIHFYPEKMGLDPPNIQANAGTKPGRVVDNPVFPVWFPKYRNPGEVWRIFYRFKDGGGPNPVTNPQPFTN